MKNDIDHLLQSTYRKKYSKITTLEQSVENYRGLMIYITRRKMRLENKPSTTSSVFDKILFFVSYQTCKIISYKQRLDQMFQLNLIKVLQLYNFMIVLISRYKINLLLLW